jgi:glycerophosphoryl diester phosphodiesterase
MARGTDTLGLNYAIANKIKYSQFPADWNTYGKRAGYVRNEQMAKYADALLAFWDGQSRGTKHMIDLAKQHGLKVRVFDYVKGEWLK